MRKGRLKCHSNVIESPIPKLYRKQRNFRDEPHILLSRRSRGTQCRSLLPRDGVHNLTGPGVVEFFAGLLLDCLGVILQTCDMVAQLIVLPL